MIDNHLRRSHAKLVLVVLSMAVRARWLSITSAKPGVLLQPFWGAVINTSTPLPKTGCAAPAFLGCGNQHVDTAGLHVDPQRTRGNAIEDEQSTCSVDGVTDRAQIRIGENDSRCRLDVRREHRIRPKLPDRSNHFVNRGWRKWRVLSRSNP